ncbi:MAG: hypothetical protein BWZ07_01011 [Alphaproteobacteria bacterium ADurb.BinA280]|jgi:uncharacterized lipoprotein YbaY|nr:YbaY family lipoprotein [Xanthomonadales bacterium]MCC6506990.1 YbaY family lipoprotein [Aquimonas sp.]OPZ12844.1 MAG: hypothetical protein BWZ07_01011 [Alphaproteobacteria bacterium ADurb.BinA280]
MRQMNNFARVSALTMSVAFLAACGDASAPASKPAAIAPAQTAATPAAPQFATAINGDLRVSGLTQLPKGIQLSIRLLDFSDPSQVAPVVAEINEPAPALLPHRFRLGYDAGKINAEGRYAVQAALLAGTAPLYSTAQPMPVLTQGAGEQVVLELVRGGAEAATQMAPTDKLKKDFAELEGKIGGFRRVMGERIDEKVTIGWDAFVSTDGVRFAREQIDTGESSAISFKYAFVNGKPMAILREHRNIVTWLGWDASGTLILNDRQGAPISDAEVADLQQQAMALYGLAKQKG